MITSSWPQFAQYTNHLWMGFLSVISSPLCRDAPRTDRFLKQSGRPWLADAPQPACLCPHVETASGPFTLTRRSEVRFTQVGTNPNQHHRDRE